MVKFEIASLPAMPPKGKCSILRTVIDCFPPVSQEWGSGMLNAILKFKMASLPV